jgi:ADP-heptose:LPS heptosyltransferase
MPARSVPEGGEAPQRIAILRALQLGDLLCSVPALRAVRAAYPRAHVTLIGLPWAEAFAARFAHLVDGFLAFPGHPALPERAADLAAFPAFLERAQAQRFDLVLQMHGRGDVTNPLALLLGGRVAAGFHPAGGWCPDPRRFCPWPEQGTEVERCLVLTDFLGLPRRGTALEFPLLPEERAHGARLQRDLGLAPGRYACMHPGARLASRRWPADRFGTVAAALAREGLRVVVTGSRDEATLCAAVARAAGSSAVDLCDRTSLGELAVLVAGARLVVCNDTGVSHVASALRTPSVVVSCGADASRFAPSDRARHHVLAHATACRPCMHEHCPTAHECATGLSVAKVLAAVRAVLGAPSDQPATAGAVA